MWGRNKSNYTPRGNWYDEDYTGSYNWYKPRFDMSVGLEVRVRQLIQVIAGKDLRLIKAEGWGNDDENFYYNPKDLEDATDDEILGRILHQLAKELFVDKKAVKKQNSLELNYRHLLNTLEDNRVDNLLQERYGGVKYYADELWQTRKFADNPINTYLPPFKGTGLELLRQTLAVYGFDNDANNIEKNYPNSKQHYDAWIAEKIKERGQQFNPSWEFCFNITALQNGEAIWDFSDDKTKANFELVVPFIKLYLSATSFDEARAIYPSIKKYYPKPTKQQQQQMDSRMAQSEGLSNEQMEHLRTYHDQRYASSGMAKSEATGEEGEVFIRDFANASRYGEFTIERAIATYREYLAKYKNVANVLYTLIRSILKDNTAARFERPFKRGRLDAKRVYKLIATDNLRIFKRKRIINQKDYLMMVVVDMSGSMDGGNAKYATQGTIVITDVLERLGFPYEVIAYNGAVYGVKMFNKALRPELLPSLEHANGSNNEREVVEVITKHCVKFDPSNNYKKSVFWITDGQSNDPINVKKRVREFERHHNAIVYAIGIGNVDEVYLKESYPTYMMVKTISELPMELVNLMRRQFSRK